MMPISSPTKILVCLELSSGGGQGVSERLVGLIPYRWGRVGSWPTCKKMEIFGEKVSQENLESSRCRLVVLQSDAASSLSLFSCFCVPNVEDTHPIMQLINVTRYCFIHPTSTN